MITPKKILIFFLLTGAFLLPFVLFMPEEGIKAGPFTLKMISAGKILGRDTVHYADITGITENIENIDSLPDVLDISAADTVAAPEAEKDTVKASASDLAASVYRLNHNETGRRNLMKFFGLLKSGAAKKQQIRVLHYGDSQIEGDRMTSYIRNKLQGKFGGYGPGLLPALQPYDSYFSVVQTNTGNWERHTTFGKPDPAVDHNRYGVLAAFSRFAPITPDSVEFHDSIVYTASVEFSESKLAYSKVRKFRKLSVLYGHSHRKVRVVISCDGIEAVRDSLEKDVDYKMFTHIFPDYVNNVKIEFSGYDSPDIYAIDLSDVTGVETDNIGMRGSSGTFFTRMDRQHLQKMYRDLNVKLFILQFGGNVMPYVKDSAAVESYGRWFYSQLTALKRMAPDAAFVVIGPSDMSLKDGENYVTYPFLPLVRNALRDATVKAGCSFWDMYSAMGGYNSMPSWVRADPPLAGADYTHFTPRGAKLIANMFYNSLMVEFVEANGKNTRKNTKVKTKVDKTK